MFHFHACELWSYIYWGPTWERWIKTRLPKVCHFSFLGWPPLLGPKKRKNTKKTRCDNARKSSMIRCLKDSGCGRYSGFGFSCFGLTCSGINYKDKGGFEALTDHVHHGDMIVWFWWPAWLMFFMLRYYVVMLMLLLFDVLDALSVCNIFFWKPLVSSSVWFSVVSWKKWVVAERGIPHCRFDPVSCWA